ncbi:ExbD/TolR family protein [Prosthecochloris sp. SCSIO W1103]|uniref:ExbD/TolR family protein n=1 Tax=Prosthecochloris sp. SCSIO W1103 TaxID=2992244 RepID=UPI00223E245B|nr:biopolymer transporter ExbD [Prosthecochloris sp. SCSIO W1103]UZJ36896.1 biopolymer transporter ExbD [Prosthecochloris sp. SCSIO W1103]UZJ36955.1 biopolymer transporter ExbD [Prosthecochloris sp. SCSIO W1103]
MGMVDSPNGESRGRRARQKRKRIGFHIDMTPMVDVAFLLLTFFMLTTTFSRANTMEINIPPEETEVKIAELNVMTVRIVEEGRAYWSIGEAVPQEIAMYDEAESPVLSAGLRKLLREETRKNNRLVIVVKLSGKAKYKNLIDLIDEFNLLKIDRFSLDDFTSEDEAAIVVQRKSEDESREI